MPGPGHDAGVGLLRALPLLGAWARPGPPCGRVVRVSLRGMDTGEYQVTIKALGGACEMGPHNGVQKGGAGIEGSPRNQLQQ